MRKGTMLSVVAGLSLAILAGCSGGTNSKQASSSMILKSGYNSLTKPMKEKLGKKLLTTLINQEKVSTKL